MKVLIACEESAVVREAFKTDNVLVVKVPDDWERRLARPSLGSSSMMVAALLSAFGGYGKGYGPCTGWHSGRDIPGRCEASPVKQGGKRQRRRDRHRNKENQR